MKFIHYILLALTSSLFLSGCAQIPSDNEVASGDTSIGNYSVDDNGVHERLVHFDEVPSRVVTGTQGASELLSKLGLADKIVGQAAIFGDYELSVAPELKKVPVITQGYPSKEQVVGAAPDLVISRAISFANNDWGHSTTADLNGLGIQTYVLATTVPDAKLDSLYTDIDNLGKIFQIEDKANQIKEEFQAKEARIAQKMQVIHQDKSFAYLSTVDQDTLTVYSASSETFFNDSLSRLNLQNIFADSQAADMGIEHLVAANPDLLFITTYEGGPSAEATKEYLYQNKALQAMSAIQNKQVFVLPFHIFWTNSYVIFDGLEMLGQEIYPNQFK